MQICVCQNDATLGEGCVSLKSLCTQDYLESRVEITSGNLDSGTVVQYVIVHVTVHAHACACMMYMYMYMYDVQCQPTAWLGLGQQLNRMYIHVYIYSTAQR